MTIPTTIDVWMNGAVVLEQPAPKHGYRVNVDSLFLARFASRCVQPNTHVIDLGAGVGAVALALYAQKKYRKLTLVESQHEVAAIAKRNVDRACLTPHAEVIPCDVLAWASCCNPQPPVVILANPPFTPPFAGRSASEPSRDQARRGPLEPFIAAIASAITRAPAVACLCYPIPRLVDAIDIAEKHNLFVQRLRLVHPHPSRPARLALIELTHTLNDPTVVEPPWFDSDSSFAAPEFTAPQATDRA